MISVTIVVKNAERTLHAVLSSLQLFEEVILVDTGSQDQTLAIASSFSNVRVFNQPFQGFGPTKNAAAKLACHDWILSLDADEVLSAKLAYEISSLNLNPNCVYSLPFHNYYKNRHVTWCGWYPEKHIRLYNRKITSFSDALVHEEIQHQKLEVATLQSPVLHYSYNSISEFLVKMERYSTLFAIQYRGKKRSSPLIALLHGAAAFFKSYILKRGFKGGYVGLLISSYNAHTAYYKYLKLYELNNDRHA